MAERAGTEPAGRFAVPADHPSLPGHFPGRPIVPGVVLLDHVLDLIVPAHARIVAVPGVKFLAAVRPGETIEVTASVQDDRIGFAATRDGAPVLRGAIRVAA